MSEPPKRIFFFKSHIAPKRDEDALHKDKATGEVPTDRAAEEAKRDQPEDKKKI